MTASSFQLLRPESWVLSLSFSPSLTLHSSGFRVRLEFAHVLPPHPTPLVELLAWMFLEEPLSNLSPLIPPRPPTPHPWSLFWQQPDWSFKDKDIPFLCWRTTRGSPYQLDEMRRFSEWLPKLYKISPFIPSLNLAPATLYLVPTGSATLASLLLLERASAWKILAQIPSGLTSSPPSSLSSNGIFLTRSFLMPFENDHLCL